MLTNIHKRLIIVIVTKNVIIIIFVLQELRHRRGTTQKVSIFKAAWHDVCRHSAGVLFCLCLIFLLCYCYRNLFVCLSPCLTNACTVLKTTLPKFSCRILIKKHLFRIVGGGQLLVPSDGHLYLKFWPNRPFSFTNTDFVDRFSLVAPQP